MNLILCLEQSPVSRSRLHTHWQLVETTNAAARASVIVELGLGLGLDQERDVFGIRCKAGSGSPGRQYGGRPRVETPHIFVTGAPERTAFEIRIKQVLKPSEG